MRYNDLLGTVEHLDIPDRGVVQLPAMLGGASLSMYREKVAKLPCGSLTKCKDLHTSKLNGEIGFVEAVDEQAAFFIRSCISFTRRVLKPH